ncbi:MAG TPA: ADP-ribosylglycohydrolase family protein [Candidatus Ozemobacteraceae bacterium]|nr:ADP-ribosylglycohydrolase family protein [Candidatus Ozemobacteraceae bacterium]
MLRDSVFGSLLGTALGDSLGLPLENLSAERAKRLFPPPLRHRFLFGGGMVSDDTEHAVLTALALARSGRNIEAFTGNLGWSLRFWVLCIPAGIGWATLRSLVKLWLGWSPANSGVFSAGNGPAMRSPVIGAAFPDPSEAAIRRDFVRAATRITHSDPRAEQGAQIAALAASSAAQAGRPEDGPKQFFDLVPEALPDLSPEWKKLLDAARISADAGTTTAGFAAAQGWNRGVSGFILHTISAVIHAWHRSPGNLREALEDIIAAGGDTDTTAAILGGIIGAGLPPAAFPQDLTDSFRDWPWSVNLFRNCGEAIRAALNPATTALPPVPIIFWPAVLLRNIGFAAIILAHGLRRLLPPY